MIFEQTLEAFIACSRRREGAHCVKLERLELATAGHGNASVGRAGVDINDWRATTRDRLKAALQPPSFIAANDHDADVHRKCSVRCRRCTSLAGKMLRNRRARASTEGSSTQPSSSSAAPVIRVLL